MRADRLLSIMLQLQVTPGVTARELARQLEVSERTIHRDMEALSGAGVPVVAERGAKGGWRLLEGYRTDLTGLNEAEALSLFIPASERVLADLGLGSSAKAALTKLLASMPAARRQEAERVRERLYVDTSTWRQLPESVAAFQSIHEAVWSQRKLAITYQRGDGETVARVVEPLGLVAKGATWYLVAACEGELRSYRASRVLRAELHDEAFERPEGFDLAAFWQSSKETFVANLPQFRLEGRVHPDLLPRLSWVGRFSQVEQVDPPEADGWSRVRVRVQTFEEAQEYALGLGTRFEVLAPSELREAVCREAALLAKHYS